MWTLRNLHYSIPLNLRIPTHPVPTLSDNWSQGYPFFCTLLHRASTFKLLATGCYRHVDTSWPIPFNSPQQGDSNETLPDSGTHLPTEISAFSFLLTCIAMRTLQNLHHSIPLNRRVPMHTVPMLSLRWVKGYPYFCTWVPWVCTFKLLATECYRHVDTLRPILFNSPHRAESNALCHDAIWPLVEGLSILLYFSSPVIYFQIVGYWVLQACGHFETYTIQFPLAGGLQWDPSPLWRTSICPLRYLPFSPCLPL